MSATSLPVKTILLTAEITVTFVKGYPIHVCMRQKISIIGF
jgi:hypothetical protein